MNTLSTVAAEAEACGDVMAAAMAHATATGRHHSRPLLPSERRCVRTIEFRTELGVPAAVTGIPERIVVPGPLPRGLRVAMVSAGRVWGERYQIPAMAEVVEVTR
jgi:hypothetical protein